MRKVILLAGTMVLGSTCLNVTSIIGEDEAPMSGRWIKEGGSSDCNCGECLNISINQGISTFCVESNQIYVSAYYVLDKSERG